MIICFDIQRETKEKMDEMIRGGHYADYSELVSIAVNNQHLLHGSPRTPGAAIMPYVLSASPTFKDQGAESASGNGDQIAANSPGQGRVFVPDIFLRSQGDYQIGVAPLPNDVFARGMTVTADRWLFGQHNKLLPAKANVRALANILARDNKSNGADLDEASREIAIAASDLGDFLRKMDLRLERSRDDSAALAFPSSEPNNSDKSRLRYANQFVGSVSREGRMTGLLVDLKLVNVDRHKPPRIRLTDAGLRFALLNNPILDDFKEGQDKFTLEETDFLISHIHEHVPVEQFAYAATLTAIQSGNDTPESLDRSLKPYLPERKDKPFTDAFLTTQRAGVISRMVDLGLVTRTRAGSNVTYVVTDKGKLFIEKGQAK